MSKQEPAICIPKRLPPSKTVAAAKTAIKYNPANLPPINRMAMLGLAPNRERIAVLTTKFWGAQGVYLTVGFMDNPEKALRDKILAHMNAWGEIAHVNFTYTAQTADAQVRIARVTNNGYWSYLGTDILHIPKKQQTMNLEGFTIKTPDSEFKRVVRHETGHTLGFPHEHLRRAVIKRLDEAKVLKYFQKTQGWTPTEVYQQVLTPIEETALSATPADETSIMCYQIPGFLTLNSKPILGGLDINITDHIFVAQLYPKSKP
jgi:hypothetical protein